MLIAARLQSSILPNSPPDIPGISLDARMLPARGIGGDFFDWFRLPDGRLTCVIADVSGKGVPAAFYMGITRTILRAASLVENPRVDRILAKVNTILSAENDELMFVSLFLAIIDPKSGGVEWANAGHPSALLFGGEDVALLAPSGPILGIDPQADFHRRTLALDRGNRLFMYTDGISEARSPSGQVFGDDRIADLCGRLAHEDAKTLNDIIIAEIMKFSDQIDQADDITCLCLDWRRS
jgi:serine phosphatase RsbU (regulator of sigma subunit)